jgi:hypothetical protein
MQDMQFVKDLAWQAMHCGKPMETLTGHERTCSIPPSDESQAMAYLTVGGLLLLNTTLNAFAHVKLEPGQDKVHLKAAVVNLIFAIPVIALGLFYLG